MVCCGFMDIYYINRQTKQREKEKIYGKFFIELLYGHNLFSKIARFLFLGLFCRLPFFSKLYGFFQKSSLSKKKITPFIKEYGVDETEFLDPVNSFNSFNDFFIRKLKPSARPITNGNDVAVLPADGRYLVYPNLERSERFLIKDKEFSLETILQDQLRAHKYLQGSMVLARLCPVDYHRFHFPCNCVPSQAKLINGPLYSVNLLALKKTISILGENKRVITELHTKDFGTILFIEVGATYVGSINQTYSPNEPYAKGDEKGYFAFGGSCLILLFEPFRIQFDQDLIDASFQGIEMRGLMGQSLGRSLKL